MQTFLPFESFRKSAKVLDYRRLGKQRVEAFQILLALQDPTYGWQSHPAVKMWKGYEFALCLYGIFICQEWIDRGYKDSLLPKFKALLFKFAHRPYKDPEWLGNEDLHSSHRSNLLRKDFGFYSQYDWSESDDLPYYWPLANPKSTAKSY